MKKGKDESQNIRWGKAAPRRQKSVKEEAELGPGRKELIFCSGCGIVYYHKSWHSRFEDWPHLNEGKAVRFVLCPACQMIKNGLYEGELAISGLKSQEQKEEIKRSLKNAGELANARDPLDRIIEIREKSDSLIVHTTENQLVVRLAKKIKLTFGGKMEISHSHEEDIIRVKVTL
jgi:NMD protein affecting ribosome stability and mRNA decay